jgi:hypothetical protein
MARAGLIVLVVLFCAGCVAVAIQGPVEPCSCDAAVPADECSDGS